MYKKPYYYDYFEQHKLYRDYRDFVLKSEYIKPILYTVGVYALDENKKEHLTEMMALTCDSVDWAVVNGHIYKKEGECFVAARPSCIRRMPMSAAAIENTQKTHFYKILKEEEFNSYAELREALEQEEGEAA